jgi:hypothetical protein
MLYLGVPAAPDPKAQLMSAIHTSQRRRSRPAISQFHRVKLAFLIAGFASLVLSVTLWFSGSRQEALFVGLWVPAIHGLGALLLVGENQALGDRNV